MALSDFTRQLVEKEVGAFCQRKAPDHIHDKMRLSFGIRGDSVTLVEHKAPWGSGKEWSKMNVAQFRFNPKSKEWTLYCADRNDRWHEYFETGPAADLRALLHEVDSDPTGIFWG